MASTPYQKELRSFSPCDLIANKLKQMSRYQSNIVINETAKGLVLRDDLLLGGTKSTFMGDLLDRSKNAFVYATPVYGGFQIALAGYCKQNGLKAVIFCAKRKVPHPNSLMCKDMGATVYQVPYGYLSNVQSKARAYCAANGAQYLEFGAKGAIGINAIKERMQGVTDRLGFEPDKIYCAIGSGTLATGILAGTANAKVIGVQVGKTCEMRHERLKVIKYDRPFDKPARVKPPFQSCMNYDAKAYEVFARSERTDKSLFWNVL